MEKYLIRVANKDFYFIEENMNAKGSRTKRFVLDNDNNMAFFKYEGVGYTTSEACSEKMSYEIAKVLGYDCAKIELAVDEEGILGVLNYLFIDIDNQEHTDALEYLNIDNQPRKKFYTISNIKNTLDKLSSHLFNDFIKIMIFDALVGEQDRHEENWGIQRINDQYKISPLYDNGCNLLRNFKDIIYADQYYSKRKSFDSYINKSKTIVYKDDNKKQYKHFELINYLYTKFPQVVFDEICKLKKLNEKIINEIVNRVPDDLLTDLHKSYIVLYLIKRRDILLKIIEGSEYYEK